MSKRVCHKTGVSQTEHVDARPNRIRPGHDEYPMMVYNCEKRTKTVSDQPLVMEDSFMLLPSSLTDDDIKKKRAAGKADISSKVSELFSHISADYTDKIQNNVRDPLVSKYIDPSRYDYCKERPVGVIIHDQFPINSLENYRFKGEVTEHMMKRNDLIQENGEVDMFLALLRYNRVRKEKGISSFSFKVTHQLPFKKLQSN